MDYVIKIWFPKIFTMTNLTNFRKMNYLIELLQKGNAGNSKDIARRITVSERTVKRKLAECRDLGYDVQFDRKLKSYYIKDLD